MKVLHIVANPGIGGLERVVEGLAAGHRRMGLDVHVAAVVTDGASPGMLAALERESVPTHTLRVGQRDYAGERRLVASLCHEVRPDVVHTHGYRADVIDAAAARKAGMKSVTTVHGFAGGDWKNRLYEWIQTRSFRRFDAVVAVSAPLARLLARRGVRPERLTTIVNAWRPAGSFRDRAAARAALGLGEGPCVGFVGRLSIEKGADVLLEAAALAGETPFQVSIVGDGRERPALEQQAASLGITSRVRFHGAVPDAGQLLTAFDCLALSSRTEGTPIVLFEAMSARVPVVASAVGGVPDVIGPAEALLVPPENPAALAAALREVLADPSAARSRAAAARRALEERYAPEPWLEAYAQLYGNVARRGPSA